MLYPILAAVLAAIISIVVTLLISRTHAAKATTVALNELATLQERLKQKEERQQELDLKLLHCETELQKTIIENTQLRSENEHAQERIKNHAQEVELLQEKFKVMFENIANKIIKDNSTEFLQLNEKNLGDILSPLKEKISLFEKKVDETYEKGLRDQTDLKAELLKLNELNTRISTEAHNLTRALKSDSKKQGNWGEMVLERILERSGLVLGQEYVRESVQENSDGEVIRPDVIVFLPDNKQIIIDSKVSLVAYERLTNAEEDHQRAEYIKAHLASIRSHIKQLSEKHYQSAKDLNTPDFVLLFIPIESSFSVAVQADQELFNYAWDRKVVIVSPSTLLATLRTIASIWKQENQTKNAKEIARLGGILYDKLVGFVSDLDKVKTNLDRAGLSYDEAMKKMQSGNGNLFRTADKMKELGAKVNKELPPKYLD